MELADLLSETLDVDCDEVWANERTPTPVRVFGVCLHSMGLSLREIVAVFEWLGVDRSHGAIWSWTHTLSEAQADPLNIVFRIEATAEDHGVQLDREALRAAFADDSVGERIFSTLKEDERRLSFRVQGHRRVESHVGLVLIDRLLTALANRLDDSTANLRKAKPW